MATFTLKGSDGGTYQVDAPDQATAQSQLDAAIGAPPNPQANGGLVGSTYTDPQTGTQHHIVDPMTMNRGVGDWTPADVQNRQQVLSAPPPQGPNMSLPLPANTSIGPSDPATEAKAANDPTFDATALAKYGQGAAAPAAISALGAQRGADRGPVGTFTRDALNSALLGIPRAGAALAETAGGPLPWSTELALEKGADATGDAANPHAAEAGKAVGTAAQMALTPEAAFATPLRAGLTSALMSGTSAATDGQGPLSVAANAVVGGVLGGSARNILSAAPVLANGLTADSQKAFLDMLQRQGMTPAQALQEAQRIGPNAVYADTGTAAQQMASKLAARDPNVGPIVSDNLNARNPALESEMGQTVNQAIGPDFNAVDHMVQLKKNTAANGTAYEPILNSGATVDVRPVRDAIANIRVDPVADGVTEGPISSALGKAQNLFVGDNPAALSIKTAHEAQSSIGDAADSAYRAGNMAQARALTNVRSALLDQMPDAYNAARRQYASDKSIEDAFTEGRNLFSSKTDGQVFDPDLLNSRLANMSDPEVQAYRMGGRKAVTDIMGQARNDPQGLRTKFANDGGYAVGKLQSLFGARPANAVLDQIDRYGVQRETTNLANAGSKTALTTAADDAIPTADIIPAGGGGGHGLSLGPVGGGALVGGELGRHIGGLAGNEMAGGAIGAGAGAILGPVASWARNKAVGSINATRLAEQTDSRTSLARALTGRPDPIQAQDLTDLMASPANPSLSRPGFYSPLVQAMTGRQYSPPPAPSSPPRRASLPPPEP